mmetsp:Transcript_9013/g.19920  ORF Transcript_9013/g.19920 Transcript_9013/m.19920 type:complete len:199 (+) Transcript_9013:48-644(+)
MMAPVPWPLPQRRQSSDGASPTSVQRLGSGLIRQLPVHLVASPCRGNRPSLTAPSPLLLQSPTGNKSLTGDKVDEDTARAVSPECQTVAEVGVQTLARSWRPPLFFLGALALLGVISAALFVNAPRSAHKADMCESDKAMAQKLRRRIARRGQKLERSQSREAQQASPASPARDATVLARNQLSIMFISTFIYELVCH